MSIQNLEHELMMLAASNDPVIQTEANTVGEYTEMIKAGKLSNDEYIELLHDVQHTISIHQNMSEMEAKERLNVAINALISIASLA
jgi:polyhydroxyalkanoate synthesis regulator phasin